MTRMEVSASEIADMMLDSIAAFCANSTRSEEDLRIRMGICQTCPNFAGDGCNRKPCGKRWGKWREKLVEGQCKVWDAKLMVLQKRV